MNNVFTIIIVFLVVCSVQGQGNDNAIFTQTGYFNEIPEVNDILSPQKNRAYYEKSDFNYLRIILDQDRHSSPILGRVDLYNNGIQVELAGEYFSVGMEDFEQIEVYNKTVDGTGDTLNYINSKAVLGTKKPLFLEVVVDGEFPLLKQSKVNFKKANYNKALDIGEKEDSYQVKVILHTLKDSKLVKLNLKNEHKLKSVLKTIFGEEVDNLIFLENEDALINYFKLKNNKNVK